MLTELLSYSPSFVGFVMHVTSNLILLLISSFSGDTDVTATRYSIDALKLPTITSWYPWYDHGKVSFKRQIFVLPDISFLSPPLLSAVVANSCYFLPNFINKCYY